MGLAKQIIESFREVCVGKTVVMPWSDALLAAFKAFSTQVFNLLKPAKPAGSDALILVEMNHAVPSWLASVHTCTRVLASERYMNNQAVHPEMRRELSALTYLNRRLFL